MNPQEYLLNVRRSWQEQFPGLLLGPEMIPEWEHFCDSYVQDMMRKNASHGTSCSILPTIHRWVEWLMRSPMSWNRHPNRVEFLRGYYQWADRQDPSWTYFLFEMPSSHKAFYDLHAVFIAEVVIRVFEKAALQDLAAHYKWDAGLRNFNVPETGVSLFEQKLERQYSGSTLTPDEVWSEIFDDVPRYRWPRAQIERRLRAMIRDLCKENAKENKERARRKRDEERRRVDNWLDEAAAFWRANKTLLAADYSRFELAQLQAQLTCMTELAKRLSSLGKVKAKRVERLATEQRLALLGEMIQLHEDDRAKERERQEQERTLAARRDAERARELERFQALLEQRCRQIVKVFNGLTDLEIDDSAVLRGEITGELATIHSAGCTFGLRLEQRMLYRLHQIVDERTWLEIEADDDEPEWSDTLVSANLLVWHELCHLADRGEIKRLLAEVSFGEFKDNAAATACADEVVVDALAMSMGVNFYAHPEAGSPIPRKVAERSDLMCAALAALASRLIRWFDDKELDAEQSLIVLRIIAELDVQAANGHKSAKKALRQMLAAFSERLGKYQALREVYANIYIKVLFWPGAAGLTFYPSLSEMECDQADFTGQAQTIH